MIIIRWEEINKDDSTVIYNLCTTIDNVDVSLAKFVKDMDADNEYDYTSVEKNNIYVDYFLADSVDEAKVIIMNEVIDYCNEKIAMYENTINEVNYHRP